MWRSAEVRSSCRQARTAFKAGPGARPVDAPEILEWRMFWVGEPEHAQNGRRGVIRTPDPRLRKPMLCSTELRDASWCTREDSNLGPGRYERLALTAEL